MTALSDREAFARLVGALDPYLDSLVFVGGWAHRLFAFHEFATPVDFEPLGTDDADVAAPLGLPVVTENIAERLKAAGFEEAFRGDDSPPISEYHLGAEDAGLYVEFLAPLLGGPRTRKGVPRDTTIVAGVTAQTLRYVDLLLEEPWRVRLSEHLGFPVGPEGVQIRIPNPACFIAQKLLVLDRRPPEKQSKDLLYIHDTIALFSRKLEGVAGAWGRVRDRKHPNVSRDLQACIDARVSEVNDLVRAACNIAGQTGRPSPPSPERFVAVCRTAMGAIFSAG